MPAYEVNVSVLFMADTMDHAKDVYATIAQAAESFGDTLGEMGVIDAEVSLDLGPTELKDD